MRRGCDRVTTVIWRRCSVPHEEWTCRRLPWTRETLVRPFLGSKHPYYHSFALFPFRFPTVLPKYDSVARGYTLRMKLRARLWLAAALFCATALQAQQAEKWEIGPFTRPASGNPVIAPRPESTFIDPILKRPVHWEVLHTFNPAAIVRDGKVYVLYRAEDDSGAMEIGGHTSRLGLAESQDGISFVRRADPVFYPADDAQQPREWPGGVEDPRLVEAEDGTYVLTYTQWNRKIFSVGVATSSDLTHWTKHGTAFADAAGGKYAELKYKSAGIVTQLNKG